MAIRLNTNLAALDAQVWLNRHHARAQNSLEHLSSGLRILHAVDDPAGIHVSVRLRVDALAFEQSARNANEGVNFVQVADSGAAEVTDILTKIRGMALQGANGLLDSVARGGLSAAFTQLKSEVQRILNTTKYTDIYLLKTTNSAGGTSASNAITSDRSLKGVKFALGPQADQVPFVYNFGISSVENSLRTAGVAATATSPLLFGSFSSISAAKSVLTSVDSAIRSMGFFRGSLGAAQDVLGVAAKADENMSANVTAALSTVRDLDFAEEVANFTQASILQQAATAFLAQANLLNQTVLQLLG